MKIDINRYFAELDYNELKNNNVISCVDNFNRRTILIRNSEMTGESAIFENEYFQMKNNIVLENNNDELGSFHVLICKKNDNRSLTHFDRVCTYLFINENEALSSNDMLNLFYSLETIFATRSEHNRSLEIGLYGELSFINYLYSKDIAVYKMWHTNFFNKHDFEVNSKIKLEVKTTIGQVRKHTFGHDQIYRDKLNVYIVSCKLQPCEKGLSLYELCLQTIDILENKEQMLAIELLMQKLGLNYDYQGLNCIKDETYDNIKLYDSNRIPHLVENIPDGISNVHYDVDLSNINSLDVFKLEEFL